MHGPSELVDCSSLARTLLDNLLNIAKVTSSIKNSIESKSKGLKEKITGDNKPPNNTGEKPPPAEQKPIENKEKSEPEKK